MSNQTDSRQGLYFSLSFRLSDKTIYVARARDYLRSLTVKLNKDSGWTAGLELFDAKTDEIENVITSLDQTSQVQLQFGWQREIDILPTFTGRIIKYNPTFAIEGVSLTLELLQSEMWEQAIDKRPRGWTAGTKISDIVMEIAALRGWKTIDPTGKPTVETSDAPLPTPLTINDESDARFISEQLKKYAVNARGEAYVFYFDQWGAVHFHSPSFRGGISGPRAQKTYRFARDSMGEVVEFSPEDVNLLAYVRGGGSAKITGTDSKGGAPAKAQTPTAEKPLGAPRLHQDERTTNQLSTGNSTIIPILARTPEELERKAAAINDTINRTAFRAHLKVLGTHDLSILDYVNVECVNKRGTPHYFGGIYTVFGVEHTFDTGGWTTNYNLTRGGKRATGNADEVKRGGTPITVQAGNNASEPNVVVKKVQT